MGGNRQKELRICKPHGLWRNPLSLAFTLHHGVGLASSQAPVGIPAVSSLPVSEVIRDL